MSVHLAGGEPEVMGTGPVLHQVDGETRVAGLIGWPVQHTLSPAMHNAAYAALGLNWRYLAFPVGPDHIRDAILGMRALRLAGLNVTIPHKETVIPYLDDLMPAARAIGAVNTIIVADDHLIGDNTDVHGFLTALDEAGVSLEGRGVLILGAGGGARAAAYALASRGARVALLARTPARSQRLAIELLRTVPGAQIDVLDGAPPQVDLLINCTPVGMWPHDSASPLPAGMVLHPGMTVMDMVYRPLQTSLLRQAHAAGARTVSGLEMLINQAAAAFERWTGVEAPIAVMREACVGAQAANE